MAHLRFTLRCRRVSHFMLPCIRTAQSSSFDREIGRDAADAWSTRVALGVIVTVILYCVCGIRDG